MATLKKNKLLYYYIIILLFVFSFGIINAVIAADNIMNVYENCDCKSSNISAECKKYCTGNYELNDFARVAIKVSRIIIGLSGSVALLAFVYGGVMFLISAGNKELVEKAKRIITGAVIGLIIVFASWAIINFIMTSLGYSFTPWYQIK